MLSLLITTNDYRLCFVVALCRSAHRVPDSLGLHLTFVHPTICHLSSFTTLPRCSAPPSHCLYHLFFPFSLEGLITFGVILRTSNSPPNSSYNTHNPSSSSPAHSPASITLPNVTNPQTRTETSAKPTIVFSITPKRTTERPTPLSSDTGILAGTSDTLRIRHMEGKGKEPEDPNRSSPSVSSSQGDMADTEMEAGPSQTSEPPPPPPPPKKKRTRTLTTPHQSAVLHALLAQSRFPTTAMREEVGRAIGLSARKVQIWFQNQRQKARRPRGQTGPPLTRPPQFGPFSNVPSGSKLINEPDSGEHLTLPMATEGGRARRTAPDSPPYNPPLSASSSAGSEYLAHDSNISGGYGRVAGSSSQLSGPGVPGASRERPAPYPMRRDIYPPPSAILERSRHSSDMPSFFPPFPPSRPNTAGESLEMHRPTPRPRSLQTRRRYSDEMDYPITLPPLILDPQSPTQSSMEPGSSRSARIGPSAASRPVLPPIADRRHSLGSQPSDSPFAHEPPHIPPPFTLQPAPLWDDPSFSPYSRPTSSSRPASSYDFPSQSPTSYLGSPREYRAPGSSGMISSLQLPSLSPQRRLHEGPSGSRSRHFVSPTRTRFDTIRPSIPSTESSLPRLTPPPGSPSRPHADDTPEKRDVNR